MASSNRADAPDGRAASVGSTAQRGEAGSGESGGSRVRRSERDNQPDAAGSAAADGPRPGGAPGAGTAERVMGSPNHRLSEPEGLQPTPEFRGGLAEAKQQIEDRKFAGDHVLPAYQPADAQRADQRAAAGLEPAGLDPPGYRDLAQAPEPRAPEPREPEPRQPEPRQPEPREPERQPASRPEEPAERPQAVADERRPYPPAERTARLADPTPVADDPGAPSRRSTAEASPPAGTGATPNLQAPDRLDGAEETAGTKVEPARDEPKPPSNQLDRTARRPDPAGTFAAGEEAGQLRDTDVGHDSEMTGDGDAGVEPDRPAEDAFREAAAEDDAEAVDEDARRAVEGDAVPDFSAAAIDDRKIADYAMNPDHPVGKHKYRVINSGTGLTTADSAAVRQQVLDGVREGTPILGKADQYGQRWAVDVPLAGPKGAMTVRTGWIVRPGSTAPELTTISLPPRSSA
jgi:hypothetical protein